MIGPGPHSNTRPVMTPRSPDVAPALVTPTRAPAAITRSSEAKARALGTMTARTVSIIVSLHSSCHERESIACPVPNVALRGLRHVVTTIECHLARRRPTGHEWALTRRCRGGPSTESARGPRASPQFAGLPRPLLLDTGLEHDPQDPRAQPSRLGGAVLGEREGREARDVERERVGDPGRRVRVPPGRAPRRVREVTGESVAFDHDLGQGVGDLARRVRSIDVDIPEGAT